MNEKCRIVIITDSNFVLAVYILIASLKYHGVKIPVSVLGIALKQEEIDLLQQLENTKVVISVQKTLGNRTSLRAIANICKTEALLSAFEDGAEYAALLDGDCIVTGDITPYLLPDKPGIYLRQRQPAEDAMIFSTRYEVGDGKGYIPQRMLEVWQKDIGQRKESALRNTVLSGNLIIHRNYLKFLRDWDAHMKNVLPLSGGQFNHVAYQMMGDFTLSSILAFSKNAPRNYDMKLDKDPNAYVAHLGPSPKFWKLWPPEKLKYRNDILKILDWAKKNNYKLPVLTWTLQRKNLLPVYITTGFYHFKKSAKNILKMGYYRIKKDFKNRKQKY